MSESKDVKKLTPPSTFDRSGIVYSTKEVHNTKEAFRGKILLFYAPEMETLAEEVAAMSNGRIILGKVHWKRFPDTFPNVMIENPRAVKWAHCAFISSMHSPFVIFEQLAVMYAIPRYLAKSLKLIVPFFPTATMERISKQGEIATAHTLAKLLSLTPHAARGPAQLTILDIHTLQNQFYFSDDVLVRLKSCTHLLRQEIPRWSDAANVVIAFPDDGAHKRFHHQFSTFDNVVCNKIRDGDSRVVKIKEGNCVGRHVVIIDDLVQSGGTLLECAKALKANGAAVVSAFVVHAVFPNNSWRKFVHVDDGGTRTGPADLKTFFLVNTHPMAAMLSSKPPFRLLSCAPILHAVLTEEEDPLTGEPRLPPQRTLPSKL